MISWWRSNTNGLVPKLYVIPGKDLMATAGYRRSVRKGMSMYLSLTTFPFRVKKTTCLCGMYPAPAVLPPFENGLPNDLPIPQETKSLPSSEWNPMDPVPCPISDFCGVS